MLEKIKSIVADQLGVDEDQVTEDASFIDDLGADSLDAQKIKTVKDVIEYIETKQ